MVRAVDPEWRLREATPAERGFAAVYHVVVEAADDVRSYVLKAPPEGVRYGVATEARIAAVVAEHTAIPVPAVVAVVDDHGEVPTPFFLMEEASGTAIPFEETGTVPDRLLRTVARQTGEYLGELHAIDAVDSFGVVRCDRAERLEGGRPSGDARGLAVTDGCDSWPRRLDGWADHELDRLEATGFADLAPRLRPWFHGRIGALRGPFSPVLGRIDHGLDNLLVDPDTGGIASVLDWGFALAVTPGYDLQCVEYVLGGAVLAALPGSSDRRGLVRRALVDGYRSTAPDPSAAAAEDHTLYELLATVRSMNHLDAGTAKVPAAHEEAVAARLRNEAEALLGSDGRR